MKYYSICFTVAVGVILCGKALSQNEYDKYCAELQQEGPVCFNKRTLGVCSVIAGEWLGYEIGACDPNYSMCCDQTKMGCIYKWGCLDEEDTTTATITTSTSTTLSSTCVAGDLRKHETDCKRYFYCSRSKWVEEVCPGITIYDEKRRSCEFGTC